MPRPNPFNALVKSVAKGLVYSKSFGVTWDGSQGWNSCGTNRSMHYPGSDMDWQSEAGCLWDNSVGMICAGYIFDKVIEPRIHVVYEDNEGLLQPVPKHPAACLLLDPNTEYTGNALLQAMALSYKFDGNAYAVKIRGNGGMGQPTALYYIPHWLMRPYIPEDGGPTEFYIYKEPQTSGGFKNVLVPRMNVIHIKDSLDPENVRVGMKRLKAQFRSFVADNEIDNTTAIVMRNRGNLGMIISPTDLDIEIDADQAAEIKRKVKNSSQGDARGETVFIDFPVKVDRSISLPKDLELSKIGERPEARICGALSIDPYAVGLGTGDGGKGGQYGAKKREARASSYESCILPLLAAIAEGMTYQLLPDFPMTSSRAQSLVKAWDLNKKRWITKAPNNITIRGAGTDVRSYRFAFDYSDVRELADDADAVSKRACTEFTDGIATLDEARELTGKKRCEDPELGGKFSFQLMSANKGGEFGTPPAKLDEQEPGKTTDTSDDPDEDDEQDHADEDPEGDNA